LPTDFLCKAGWLVGWLGFAAKVEVDAKVDKRDAKPTSKNGKAPR
jgi:hypothetical protein